MQSASVHLLVPRHIFHPAKPLGPPSQITSKRGFATSHHGLQAVWEATPFDLEEYKDSFELWEKQWEVFLALSTIDSTLAAADRPAYKRNILLSCLSKETLQTLLNMGLTTAEMENVATIIEKLKDRCNAGRNRHVFRRQFALRVQRPGEGIDNWLSDVRDLAKKMQLFRRLLQ